MDEILNISSITNKEYVQLVSTYWYMCDENFNCFKCKKKYSLGVRDKNKACFTPREKEIVNYNGSIKYFTCPSNNFNHSCVAIIDMHRLFQAGILPFTGGLSDQPAKIIEFFKIIDGLNSERQKDLERKQKWQKTQSRSNSQSMSRRR